MPQLGSFDDSRYLNDEGPSRTGCAVGARALVTNPVRFSFQIQNVTNFRLVVFRSGVRQGRSSVRLVVHGYSAYSLPGPVAGRNINAYTLNPASSTRNKSLSGQSICYLRHEMQQREVLSY